MSKTTNMAKLLLTFFPHEKDTEVLRMNGFVVMKNRHGQTKELLIQVFTEESYAAMKGFNQNNLQL